MRIIFRGISGGGENVKQRYFNKYQMHFDQVSSIKEILSKITLFFQQVKRNKNNFFQLKQQQLSNFIIKLKKKTKTKRNNEINTSIPNKLADTLNDQKKSKIKNS